MCADSSAGRQPTSSAGEAAQWLQPVPAKSLPYTVAGLFAVPKQRWVDFSDAHPDGHVVVALVLRKGWPAMDKARVEGFRGLLESLIAKLAPAGAYATTIVPQEGVPEIYCNFEKQADAQRFAEAVRALPGHYDPGWAGQWRFVLDDATSDEH